MTFDRATDATASLMALAFVQQSLEHLRPAAPPGERLLFALRLLLSILLVAAGIGMPVAGIGPGPLTVALLGVHLLILPYFNGPYNGGADRMGLLMLACLCGAFTLPEPRWRELAFAYLGGQLLLSYLMAGWVKIANRDWRSGRALRDVFLFSA